MKNLTLKLLSLTLLISPLFSSCGISNFEDNLFNKLLNLKNISEVKKLKHSNKNS